MKSCINIKKESEHRMVVLGLVRGTGTGSRENKIKRMTAGIMGEERKANERSSRAKVR